MENMTIEGLVKNMERYTKEDLSLVRKAYDFAQVCHKGQFRQSGEAYIMHPLNVAYILAEIHADIDTICAGLLHDVLEDTNKTKEELETEFNHDVATLVEGVTKISKLNFSTKKEQNMANTRKIITNITKDVRIVIIKLADRLHNMRTLEFKSKYKQIENSLETIEIFVPLAYYIGSYRIKSELEDLSLRYLMPEAYYEAEEIRLKQEEKSKECLEEMLYKINYALNDRNIPNEIKIRIKKIYGIYKGLRKDWNEKGKVEDIHDFFSLKIMVDDISNCYQALGIVHQNYHPINNKFKDYICNPKTNMYQSLHSTVFGPEDRMVQTQIRTFDMDKVASFGLATYWDINKGNARDIMQEELTKKYQFFKSLIEINAMFGDNQEFVEQVKNELFSKQIYVSTPKGDRIELPKGSTIIDFAYQIHTNIGNKMTGAIVNERNVPITYQLKNDDRVRIITDNSAEGPQESWLNYAQTAKAKRKIKEYRNRI